MPWKFTNINNLLHKDASQLVGQILREALTKKTEGHTTKLVSGFRGGSKLRMSLDVIGFCIINIYIYMESPHSQSRTRMSSWSCSKRLQEPENLICKDPRPKYGPAKLVTFCGGRMSIPGMMGRDKDAESLDIVSVCLSWHLEIPIAHGKMDENG